MSEGIHKSKIINRGEGQMSEGGEGGKGAKDVKEVEELTVGVVDIQKCKLIKHLRRS